MSVTRTDGTADGRDRRGQRAAARGTHPHPHRRRAGRRRGVRQRRRAAEAGPESSRRTSSSSTSGCRRRTATRACGRRCGSASDHPDVAVLVLSQYVELGSGHAAAVGVGGEGRLPAQGPDQRRRRVRRCRSPGGRRRIRDRSADRHDAAAAAAERRPAGPTHPAGAGGARADGRRQLQRRHRRPVGDHPARGGEVRLQRVRQARPALDAAASPAACSPCCSTCGTEIAGDRRKAGRSTRNPNPRPPVCPVSKPDSP